MQNAFRLFYSYFLFFLYFFFFSKNSLILLTVLQAFHPVSWIQNYFAFKLQESWMHRFNLASSHSNLHLEKDTKSKYIQPLQEFKCNIVYPHQSLKYSHIWQFQLRYLQTALDNVIAIKRHHTNYYENLINVLIKILRLTPHLVG